ncbi:HET-domain-containing protein [Eremomyces bilateralis CBS 781.70]|uniref:HET-domain-containing protein n=1 Tax=Eremomyces bilateralis CBS 781.70 TaxID=1392243 RepID=A0A6G1GC52_9PEZI|nr:HET-domain-containing protein [Eremomyces bilateralis CBS 781.70]KAF1815613.1 HET-domain-containing protein [Eremomyces bilateralis CBS 781.70]
MVGICQSCQSLVEQALESRHRYGSEHADLDLKTLLSRRSSCTFCDFILRIFYPSSSYGANNPSPESTILAMSTAIGSYWDRAQYVPLKRLELTVFGDDDGLGGTESTKSAFVLPLRPPGLSSLCCGRRVKPSLDFGLVQEWLDLCDTKHSHSSQEPSAEALALPFRLIDTQKACVVELEITSRYAALSYVWGDCKRLLLNKDTYPMLTTPHALDSSRTEVPATFRDAIELAQRLGFQYLWIDALCIVQERAESAFKNHLKLMNEIYDNAQLTIVSGMPNAETGLPGMRSHPRSPVQQEVTHGDLHFSSAQPFAQAIGNLPWESRGWTLQEKIFSTRLLIFTESQAFYQCQSAVWQEDTILESEALGLPQLYLEEHSREGHKSFEQPGHAKYRRSMSDPFPTSGYKSTITVYSQRDLTNDEDVLFALEGILSNLKPRLGPHFSGIPSLIFGEGLLWRFEDPRTLQRRIEFPTWSFLGWKSPEKYPVSFQEACSRRTNFHISFHRLDWAKGDLSPSLRLIESQPGSSSEYGGQTEEWPRYRKPAFRPLKRISIQLLNRVSTSPSSSSVAKRSLSFDPAKDHLSLTLSPVAINGAQYTSQLKISRQSLRSVVSQTICFLTMTAKLLIAEETLISLDPKLPNEGHIIRNPVSLEEIGTIVLPEFYQVEQSKLGDFIVVNTGMTSLSRKSRREYLEGEDEIDEVDEEVMSVMLIEYRDGIAYRVQLCDDVVLLNKWKSVNPKWQAIAMA